MTDSKYSSELDEILQKLSVNNGEEYHRLHTEKQDFKAADSHMRYYENEAKAKLEALITEQVVEELESLLEIPGKYIDDGTMVYWSDFNASTLEDIIKDRINQLKGKK